MKKKVRATLAVMAGAILVGIVARVFIIVIHTDMNTGFLYHGEELLCNLMYYGVIAAASVAAIFAARSDEKDISEQTAAGICAPKVVVMGMAVLLAGVFALIEGIGEIKAVSPMKFRTATDLVFAAILIATAVFTLYNRKFTPGIGYMYSLIGVFCICRGMYCFMNRMAIVTVPEYLIEALTLICMSVFFVVLAKYLSGNQSKHTRKAIAFWGTGTAALALSSSFGTLIASVAAPDVIRSRIVFSAYEAETFRQSAQGVDAYNMTMTPWVDFLLGVLTAAALVAVFTRSPKSGKSEP